MKKVYIPKRFSPQRARLIIKANEIIEEYRAQGYSLTLRQLYYQFVARDLIPNTQAEYNRLGSTINDARLAGHIDWSLLEDRTREMKKNTHWESPKQILEAARDGYRKSMWKNQPEYVEVWIEKDALIGVIEKACKELDVPYFSCRGYTSQSEMWRAGQRMLAANQAGKEVTILHLGDHDPSGIDMTWDIWKRMNLFVADGGVDWKALCDLIPRDVATQVKEFKNPFSDGLGVTVKRIALNHDQVEEYDPPPNPAKMTDSRIEGYLGAFGSSSWELDSLDPATINSLVKEEVGTHIDEEAWAKTERKQERERKQISKFIDQL